MGINFYLCLATNNSDPIITRNHIIIFMTVLAIAAFFIFRNKRLKSKKKYNYAIDSIVSLMSVVIKSKGKISENEINYIKAFLIKTLGKNAKHAFNRLKIALTKDTHLEGLCYYIRNNNTITQRIHILHMLFGLIYIDGISKNQEQLLNKISQLLGINNLDYISIKAMYIKNDDSPYNVLKLKPSASTEEIKRAYKEMVKIYHPDKVAQLGKNINISTNEKFHEINKAYETIKAQRNIK